MDDCIVWTGRLDKWGYGVQWSGRRPVSAHRLTWEKYRGPIPDGMLVCHHCDVPSCINVEHLFLGTPQDNMTDMSQKGRGRHQKQTHCKNGHEFNEENTYRTRRRRICRKCNAIASAKYSQKESA